MGGLARKLVLEENTFSMISNLTGFRPDGGTMAPAEKCRKHGKNGTQRRYWVRVVRTMQWLDH